MARYVGIRDSVEDPEVRAILLQDVRDEGDEGSRLNAPRVGRVLPFGWLDV
jgi:hypothetical protein